MFNFSQKLLDIILDIQEKLLGKSSKRLSSSVYSNTTSKKFFSQSASLELTSKTNQSRLKLEENIKTILKKYENNPQKLLEFIEKKGTKIYKVPFAPKILRLIKYEEGLVNKVTGLKALYLNIIISILAQEQIKLSFKRESSFIIDKSRIDNYKLIQQFHKWYAMKLNLPGFDEESQNNFQKFITSNEENVQSLTIDEILGLKEAIARDVEAINFIVDFAKSTTGSKNAMKKITAGGASV